MRVLIFCIVMYVQGKFSFVGLGPKLNLSPMSHEIFKMVGQWAFFDEIGHKMKGWMFGIHCNYHHVESKFQTLKPFMEN